MKKLILPLIFALATFASAQTTPPSEEGVKTTPTGTVSILSRGKDVRDVLFDLFTQGKKNFVLQPGVRFLLYLNLAEVEFEEALAIVLNLAELKSEKQNGIYFLTKKTEADMKPKPAPAPLPVKPKGKLTPEDMKKTVATKFSVTDIKAVFAELSKQSGLTIELSPKLPNYRIDAFFNETSIKFALDSICRAAKLKWSLTDNKSIRIEPAA